MRGGGYDSKCNVHNRTIFLHDNLGILRGINSRSIDLIYLDPPFNKNKKFTAPIGSSAEGAEFSDIFREEDVKDEWLRTIDEDQPELYRYLNGIKGVGKPYNFAYLAYMAIRLIECQRTLKRTGSIYLHCDPTMSHYLKTTMDCIFGEENFRNEIVWCYSGGGQSIRDFPKKHDVILRYVNSREWVFNMEAVRVPYDSNYQATVFAGADTRAPGRVYRPNPRGKLVEDWWRGIPRPYGKEHHGYPTQKPLLLLQRIIKASSNKSDIVLDPFCGCATTLVAAESLERKWIGADVSKKAYDLVKFRLEQEIARPDDFPQYRPDINLETRPPNRTDVGADYREEKFVYIISHPKYDGEYKVGIAKNPKARLNSYQTSDPERQYSLEFSLKTPLFRETEDHIHKHFPNKREWVQADLKDIQREIKAYASSTM